MPAISPPARVIRRAAADCTGNGIPDGCEPDCNSNLVADSCDIAGGTSIDCNLNGTPDECEVVDCVTAVQAGGPIDDPATFGGTPAENANITVGSEGIPFLGRLGRRDGGRRERQRND